MGSEMCIRDRYICTAYLSPSNSSYVSKLDYSLFDTLEQEVASYCNKGQVILMGDFNSRTGTLADNVTSVNPNIIPQADTVCYDTKCVPRKSQDSVVTCSYCKQLIDLCISSGLKIVNGRLLGDPVGRYTCHKYNGSSVVDYVLADNTVLSHLRYFIVNPLTDHSCLLYTSPSPRDLSTSRMPSSA